METNEEALMRALEMNHKVTQHLERQLTVAKQKINLLQDDLVHIEEALTKSERLHQQTMEENVKLREQVRKLSSKDDAEVNRNRYRESKFREEILKLDSRLAEKNDQIEKLLPWMADAVRYKQNLENARKTVSLVVDSREAYRKTMKVLGGISILLAPFAGIGLAELWLKLTTL